MPSIPRPLLPDDDGGTDVALTAALQAHAEGHVDARAVIAPLSTARLLVPVVALLTEAEVGEHGLKQEKESEIALPKLVGQDGREAVLAFTGAETLALWRPDARPIQATGPQVCQAALQEQAAAVIIDVAGPASFVIEGTLLHTLAALHGPADQIAGRLAAHGVTTTTAAPAPSPPRRRRFPWSRR
ncbi:SseB family protein [Spongiactinospora rosea]|uniref:SseB family protein n=1 Tax=Spongiactinospora rosea TaxID=2248750 RepID=A0A366M289_9ACTN|nr:SseB family protein [Spongiactinospora rosea]RBQ19552.1 SseB family protein [Spongiactinospora rosea]